MFLEDAVGQFQNYEGAFPSTPTARSEGSPKLSGLLNFVGNFDTLRTHDDSRKGIPRFIFANDSQKGNNLGGGRGVGVAVGLPRDQRYTGTFDAIELIRSEYASDGNPEQLLIYIYTRRVVHGRSFLTASETRC